ncbi:MAG: SUMF1/EgtB/PvdO family nonheme iron enzyme [Deltaproteobacteria bacterium]|nr:SUMF1/EgtB/PvdO family nonheme iron enzyme [Deltaproteobacteria bacterium]
MTRIDAPEKMRLIERLQNYNGGPNDGNAWFDSPRGSSRVVRGGSWYDDAHRCRSAIRSRRSPSYRRDGLGFRLSRSVSLGP